MTGSNVINVLKSVCGGWGGRVWGGGTVWGGAVPPRSQSSSVSHRQQKVTARFSILRNHTAQESHLPHFLGLFFTFLFFIKQFSLFFSAVL